LNGKLAMMSDMSGPSRSEQQVMQKAQLLDLRDDAILVRDYEDRITFWNDGATQIYGYRRDQALGQVAHQALSLSWRTCRLCCAK
jgi:PAS domain S-box-containing protein